MFRIKMKHWNVDTGHDIQRVTLRNPQGEIIAQCSF